MSKLPVWARVLLASALFAVGLFYTVRAVGRSQLQRALGPHAHVDELALLTAQVAVRGVRVDKPNASWPTEAQLRVGSLTIDLALSALTAHPRTIPKLTIEGLYIAIVRRRDGSTHVLPDLTEAPDEPADDAPSGSLHIDDLELRDATVEYVDDTMKQRVRIKLTHLSGHIQNLQLPSLEGQTGIELDGKVPGPRTTGTLELRGAMALTSLDTKLKLLARGLDLHVFEPYLIKSMDTGVEQGHFDFALAPTIRARKVRAPGHIEIHGLKLADSDTTTGSFMNMPRAAAVKALAGRDGTIETDFELRGDL
ncbi:MAG TPA: DUF748 domain-containing protein, partial [Polyangiales bacterium]|nr:DUF748 domain-containing protein [Polyangiales bacterium]